MKTPLPNIEDVRKNSNGAYDNNVEVQREKVIAAILVNASNHECHIDHSVYGSIQQELILGGYYVATHITAMGIRTIIQW
jgi:hypothetical protein